jgi:hypothetical protein
MKWIRRLFRREYPRPARGACRLGCTEHDIVKEDGKWWLVEHGTRTLRFRALGPCLDRLVERVEGRCEYIIEEALR